MSDEFLNKRGIPCKECKENSESHYCPFDEEIYGIRNACGCCEDCTLTCSQEI